MSFGIIHRIDAATHSFRCRMVFVNAGLLLLAGCGGGSYTLREEVPPAPVIGQFEALPGRGPDVVAQLRAAAAPDQPEIADGGNDAADQHALAAKGYMMIGDAHFPNDDATLRADALERGTGAGADKVLLYPPDAAARTAAGTPVDAIANTWLAVYYVRVKPPFGATFRDLSATEQETLGVRGGVRIGSVIGGTPAAQANLLHDDVLVEIDHQPIADKAAFENLLKARLGQRVTLTIQRNGDMLERIVRLGVLAPR